MLDAVKVTEELKLKYQLEINSSREKVEKLKEQMAQLQGYIVGMAKAQQLAEEYVGELVAKTPPTPAETKAEEKEDAPAETESLPS